MKKLLLAVMTLATLASSSFSPMVTEAAATTNKEVITQYVRDSFPENDYIIKFVSSDKLTNKMLRQRKKNGIIYAEKVISISCGTYGRTADGRFIRYNKKEKVGKKVNSFLVYNPASKSNDDIIAVVDHKRIR